MAINLINIQITIKKNEIYYIQKHIDPSNNKTFIVDILQWKKQT